MNLKEDLRQFGPYVRLESGMPVCVREMIEPHAHGLILDTGIVILFDLP